MEASRARSSTSSRSRSQSLAPRAPCAKVASTARSCPSPSWSTNRSRRTRGSGPTPTAGRLAQLTPAFKADGVVTAGNSLADQPTARPRCSSTSEEAAARLGLDAARARSASFALAGVRPGPDAHRADPRDRSGARACQAAHSTRSTVDRDQRGVRECGAGLGPRGAPRMPAGQRQRRRDRAGPPARRSGARSWPRCSCELRAQRPPRRPPARCARAAALANATVIERL